jgi:hypothetical protein
MEIPGKLYKYMGFNINTLKWLVKNEVFYQNPQNFNDPLDCNPSIINNLEVGALDYLCEHLINVSRGEKSAEKEMNSLRYNYSEHGDITIKDSEAQKGYIWGVNLKIESLLFEEFTSNGVLSLTENWKSPLMWSHYADYHKGICIEYDIQNGTLNNSTAPFQVNYNGARGILTSDIYNWKISNSADAENRVREVFFLSKAPEWEYESEWRCVSGEVGVHFSAFPISAVYFGMQCEQPVVSTLVKLFDNIKPIDFYIVKPNRNSFDLYREDIDKEYIAAFPIQESPYQIFKDIGRPLSNPLKKSR